MNIKELLGKTLVKIEGEVGADEMIFICSDESLYGMGHDQD